MRLAIADTGPINYLILIGRVDVLPRIFARVVIPTAVQAELSNPIAPQVVQRWIASPPPWLEIAGTDDLAPVSRLHRGESAAIALASALEADLLIIDERAGSREARKRGLCATGTLGVLDLAADRGLIDFAQAIAELERTSFRRPDWLLESLLAKHSGRQK